MRKFLFLLATAAITLIGCSDNEVIKNDLRNNTEGDAITFSSYTQPVTKAENSTQTLTWDFFTHHTTFQVWGFKNTAAINKPVFDGQKVTVTGTTGNYTYTNEVTRFWDKAATKYEFYAAAPQFASDNADKWTFTAPSNSSTQADGYFTTSSSLNGANLQETTPSVDLYNTFKSAVNSKSDYDKLIASPCPWTEIGSTVQLHFNHILSKLNVSIKKSSDLSDWTVKIKSFEVRNLYKKGDFDESDSIANQTAMTDRWDNQSDRTLVYAAKADANGWELSNVEGGSGDNGKYLYIIESLAIPQEISFQTLRKDGATTPEVYYADVNEYNTAKSTSLTSAQFDELNPAEKIKTPKVMVTTTDHPYFVINYTMTKDDFTEELTAYYNLAAAFGAVAQDDNTTTEDERVVAFNEGWQNTLNILIKPDKIEFTADIYQWATGATNSFDVK